MIGHIYINGQIGSYNDVIGVELQDVVVQAEANKDADFIHVHIDSPGGSVLTGGLISDYIGSLDNTITIAENLCGSIATQIHLSVPLERRKIVQGTKYFIHNPLLEGVTGNADDLTDAAEFVKKYEREMAAMYVKNTGAEKSAIEGLMKAETSLTDEQCKSLNFVSEVLPKNEIKAVAFIETKKEKKQINLDMTSIKKMILDGFKDIRAELNINKEPEVKATTLSTDKGDISFQSEGALPEVGEAVTIDGQPTGEGDYLLADGTVIKVSAESTVTEIIPVEAEATKEELQAKIEELETAAVTREKEFKNELESEITALKRDITSNYEPKAEVKDFKKRGQKKVATSMKEKVAELKEQREEAKK